MLRFEKKQDLIPFQTVIKWFKGQGTGAIMQH